MTVPDSAATPSPRKPLRRRRNVGIRILALVCGVFLLGLAVMIFVGVPRGSVEPDTTGMRVAAYVIGVFFGGLGLLFLGAVIEKPHPVRVGATGIRKTLGTHQLYLPWGELAMMRVEVLKTRGNFAAPLLRARPGRIWLEFAFDDPRDAESRQPVLKRLRCPGGARDGFTHYLRVPPESLKAVVANPGDPSVYVPEMAAEISRHLGPRFRGCVLKLTATTYTNW